MCSLSRQYFSICDNVGKCVCVKRRTLSNPWWADPWISPSITQVIEGTIKRRRTSGLRADQQDSFLLHIKDPIHLSKTDCVFWRGISTLNENVSYLQTHIYTGWVCLCLYRHSVFTFGVTD